MTFPVQTEVLICGAGAAGLALAIELARRHIDFVIIEKQEGPFKGSRGKGIQPRSLEIFEDMGIVDRLAAIGGNYPVLRKYQSDGTFTDVVAIEAEQATPAVPYPAPLMAPQFMTEGVMRERLAELGHKVSYATELLNFTQDSEGVKANLSTRNGSGSIRSRYLVGTDGGRSVVRQALDIGFPGKTLGMRALVADLRMSGLSRDAWHRFNDASMQHLNICPLRGTDLFQLQAPVPPDGDIDISVEGLQAMVTVRTGLADLVVKDVQWASVYTMSARLADHYRDGRVFIAGDAAHVHPPTGGQGLNTSIQDAYNLGWKLAAVLHGAPAALLDTYEEERRPVAAQMLDLSTRILDEEKRGVTVRGAEARQLHIGYPNSSLTLASTNRTTGILPGDRAPDAHMVGRAGQPVRLFNLFCGTHWTLLAYEPVDKAAVAPRAGLRQYSIGDRGDLLDRSGHFQHAYGLEEGARVLVRPDGYLAAIFSANELPDLERYLLRIFNGAQPA